MPRCTILWGWESVYGFAVEFNRTAIRLIDTGYNVNDGCLAGPVRTRESDDLALFHSNAETVQGLELTEFLNQALNSRRTSLLGDIDSPILQNGYDPIREEQDQDHNKKSIKKLKIFRRRNAYEIIHAIQYQRTQQRSHDGAHAAK